MCLVNFLFMDTWIISTFCLFVNNVVVIKSYPLSTLQTHSHIEVLTSNVTIFEDGGCKDVVKVTRIGPSPSRTGVLKKR